MKKILLMLIVSMLAQGGAIDLESIFEPGSSQGAVYSTDILPAETKDEIDALNDELIEKLLEADKEYLENIIYSEEKDLTNINELTAVYSQIFASGIDYRILDQYYFIVTAQGGSSNTMAVSDDNTYIVSTRALTGDIFISLLVFKYENHETLLTIEYVKEAVKWELRTLYAGEYSYYGDTALDSIAKAQDLSEQGQHLSAFLNVYFAASHTAYPSTLMQYNDIQAMNDLLANTQADVLNTVTFPMEFEGIPGVVFYNIDIKTVTTGLMPDIMYTTSLDLNDTSEANCKALNDEAYLLHKKIIELFPDLEVNFYSILYGASNEKVDAPEKEVHRYGTIVEN